MDKIITIKEAKSEVELIFLKSRLEEEGIDCFLTDGLSSQVLNYIPAISCRLMANEKDEERIRQIMNELEGK